MKAAFTGSVVCVMLQLTREHSESANLHHVTMKSTQCHDQQAADVYMLVKYDSIVLCPVRVPGP